MTESEREAMLAAARNELLGAMPEAWAIYVYGSIARGEEWPQSDLDLAVLLPPQREIPDVLELIARVSVRVAREVDLVDLRRVGDVLRYEVLESGLVIHMADPDRVLEWEASAMTRYSRHREETRGILEDFDRTGIGYGS